MLIYVGIRNAGASTAAETYLAYGSRENFYDFLMRRIDCANPVNVNDLMANPNPPSLGNTSPQNATDLNAKEDVLLKKDRFN